MADPIFIFSSGQRCGSTLLQRLLNSHKDILIWGEQHGSIIPLYEMNNKLLKWESNHRSQRKIYLEKGYDNFTPNLVPSDCEIIDASRDYLLSLFAKSAKKLDKKIWGFKEVRYDYEISCFLLKLFPNAKIIWLTRNVVDCFILHYFVSISRSYLSFPELPNINFQKTKIQRKHTKVICESPSSIEFLAFAEVPFASLIFF